MCQTLGVSKTQYYHWLKQPVGVRHQRNEDMDDMIKLIFHEHRGRYGSTRIQQELKARGYACTREYISSRMRINGLYARAKHKFKVTTDSRHHYSVAPNLLKQDFTTQKRDEKWLTDITYIPTREGWLYLCVFMDLYSRAVIGWSMSHRLKHELVTDALQMTLFRRGFARDVIVHSDRGVQYSCDAYQQLLKDNYLICSMSGKGCCYDNAPVESFFHSLKVELVHDEQYQTREEAKSSLIDYIECYYNRKRRHSAIDYQYPIEREMQYQYAA